MDSSGEEIYIELSIIATNLAEKEDDPNLLLDLLRVKLGEGYLLQYITHRLKDNKKGTFLSQKPAHRPKKLAVNRNHFKWYCLSRYYQLKENTSLNKGIMIMIHKHDPNLNEETVRDAIQRLKKNRLSDLFNECGGEPDLKLIKSWCIKYKYLLPHN